MTNCNFTNNAALGTDISTLFLDLKDLNQIEYGTSLPDKSSFGLNKVFVLIQYNGDQKANYTMYSINKDNDEWTILEFTTETGPSPIDWVTDEYFGGDGGTIFSVVTVVQSFGQEITVLWTTVDSLTPTPLVVVVEHT